jgi:hypothetical protein
MAERSQHRASEGQEGRSECPATGTGSPEPGERLKIKRDRYDSLAESAEHVAGRLRDFAGACAG